MKICPKCNYSTAFDSTNFCFKDGTKLEMVKKCICGESLPDYKKYCDNCGRKADATN